MKVDWLIVGAGFTGATVAERIATQLDQKVLLVDRRFHVGGNAYDYYSADGLLIHRYGPHIFHTNSRKVWDYLSRFTDWRPYYHRVLAVVDGRKIPVPFNLNSLHAVFPRTLAEKLEALLLDEFGFGQKVPILKLRENANGDLHHLADFIYEKIFSGYTKKQWDRAPEQLDASVTARVPVHISKDDRYFQDAYQAMPRTGYSELFRRMLDHPNIRVLLNTDYRDVADEVRFTRMLYTGPVDAFFDHAHGHLPYRSIRFDISTLTQRSYQEVGTVNYPNEHPFTRITEQKHLTGQRSRRTAIITEYPEPFVDGVNEPLYPVPDQESHALYRAYCEQIKELDGRVLFAGRLGDYKYYNMDQAIARALHIFETAIARNDPAERAASVAAVR